MTKKKIANKIYRQRCLEHNKDASKCFGQYYVSGNRSRRSGYDHCKFKDTCFFYINREHGWNDKWVTFGSVIDFRKCNYGSISCPVGT
jgi:hypothetical protein